MAVERMEMATVDSDINVVKKKRGSGGSWTARLEGS